MELADGTGLTYFWWYAVPGDASFLGLYYKIKVKYTM
jgi:hypothetical protein